MEGEGYLGGREGKGRRGLLTNREFDKFFALVSLLKHICKVELLT